MSTLHSPNYRKWLTNVDGGRSLGKKGAENYESNAYRQIEL